MKGKTPSSEDGQTGGPFLINEYTFKQNMELRKEIEPKLEIAEKRFPEILNLIMEFSEFLDENGDEDGEEYQNVSRKLHLLTNKEISKFNIHEYDEEEGAEVLAFRIGLPDPVKSDPVSKEEVLEIVSRLRDFEEPAEGDESFATRFKYHLDGYYHQFLKLNFKAYRYQFFNRQKDAKGNYFEYSVEEIVEKITG